MCEFPSWIQTEDGEVLFLVDKDVEALIECGKITCWEDGIGHSAIEKMTGKTGLHKEQSGLPYEVIEAIRAGLCTKMAKAYGYDVIFWKGKHEVKEGKALAIDHAVVVSSGDAVVHCSGSSRVEARDRPASRPGARPASWPGARPASRIKDLTNKRKPHEPQQNRPGQRDQEKRRGIGRVRD